MIPLVSATPAPRAIIVIAVVIAVVVAAAGWPVILLGLPRYLFGIAGLALLWLFGRAVILGQLALNAGTPLAFWPPRAASGRRDRKPAR